MPLSTIVQLYRDGQFDGGGSQSTRRKQKTCCFFVFSIFELCLIMSFFYLPWSSVFHLLMAFDNMLVHSDLTVFKVRVFSIVLSKSKWSISAHLKLHCILLRVP